MAKKTRNKPIVLCDTREKNPFNFESDIEFESTIYRKLDFGDYSLEGFENEVCIERKASVDELLVNFFSKENKDRIHREFERMLGCKHKFLIIEASLNEVLEPTSYFVAKSRKINPKIPPAVVLTNLVQCMLKYGIIVLFAGQHAQKIAKKILLEFYESRS